MVTEATTARKQTTKPNMVVGYIVAIVVTSTTFLVHCFIFTILLLTPSLRRKRSNQLLMTLNIAHVLSSILVLARVLYFEQPLPGLLSYAIFSAYSQSNVALVVLTVDRSIMIRWPFRYQTLPGWFHCVLMVVSPTTFGSVFTTAKVLRLYEKPPRESDIYQHTVVYGIIILTAILLLANSFVYMTVLKQRRSITSLFNNIVPKDVAAATTTADQQQFPSIELTETTSNCFSLAPNNIVAQKATVGPVNILSTTAPSSQSCLAVDSRNAKMVAEGAVQQLTALALDLATTIAAPSLFLLNKPSTIPSKNKLVNPALPSLRRTELTDSKTTTKALSSVSRNSDNSAKHISSLHNKVPDSSITSNTTIRHGGCTKPIPVLPLRNSKDIVRHESSPSSTTISTSTSRATTTLKIREFRSFYLCFGCVVTYVVLWLPTLVNEAARLHLNYNKNNGSSDGGSNYGDSGGGMTSVFNEKAANLLLILNPLADAVILVWFNKELKNKMKSFIVSLLWKSD